MSERMVIQMKNVKRSTNDRIRAFGKRKGWNMEAVLEYLIWLGEAKERKK